MSKIVAITGGESYIAGVLKEALQARGIANLSLDLVARKDPNTVISNICSDDFAGTVPEGCDAVVHLAAISRDKDCKANPQLAARVNLEGTQRVIDACIQRGVKQLIFASTEWVYGDVEEGGTQSEDQPLIAEKTQNVYAMSKLTGEQLCRFAHQDSGLPITVLRFGIVYGPRKKEERQFSSAVESIFYKIQVEDQIQVGSLATGRRFIHVKDLAAGIVAAIGRTGFEIFNVSGDRIITLGEVIRTSCEVLGKEVEITETSPAARSVRNPDNGRAKQILGWKPEISLSEGLRSLQDGTYES